jgi:hypothetical protein
METPPEIQFQGMQGTPEIEKTIAAHIAELDERFGRITACRVVVKAPSQHHHEGGLYEVHIRLLLPEGHEVNVERTRRTSAEPNWHLLSVTPSSMRANNCMTRFGAHEAVNIGAQA